MTGLGIGGKSPHKETGTVQSPVTRKLFRAAFALYLGAAIVITAAFVGEAWYSARNDLKRELSIYRRTLEEALAAPLWSVDIEAATAIATGMLEIPEIVGVRIADHTGTREFVLLGAPAQSGWFGDSITVNFPVYYRHAVGRDMVGMVSLMSSSTVLAERLQWRIILIIVAAILKTAILWVIFDRLGRSILARPLIQLTRAVRESGWGRLHPVEFDARTAASASGTEIEHLRVAYNDLVSALTLGQREFAALNQDLETRVAARTRELQERTVELSAALARVDQARRQTAAALDAAERAGRAKSEFLALVSHELRTPLNSILGFSELVRDQVVRGADREQMSEYAADIHDSGAHLLTLINDILDLSKIEAGQMEIHPEWIDPVAITRTVVELMRAQAARKDLAIECRLDRSIGPMRADPRRFRQMLMNLLSNAVKFTDPPGTVAIEGGVTPEGGVTIAVVDTGIGMRSQDVARALEPFGQIDSPITRSQQGTGLGLPLVSQMARLHGGRLSVDSSPGVGTRATLWFPPESRRNPPITGQ
ncbi:ATP-binding protein [Thalassobaculum sp.]|uniref:sensor histidine kinase n=1 Tax=Thalassobaculum sp. TaxID=2022740 RepID=UPI0032F041F2